VNQQSRAGDCFIVNAQRIAHAKPVCDYWFWKRSPRLLQVFKHRRRQIPLAGVGENYNDCLAFVFGAFCYRNCRPCSFGC